MRRGIGRQGGGLREGAGRNAGDLTGVSLICPQREAGGARRFVPVLLPRSGSQPPPDRVAPGDAPGKNRPGGASGLPHRTGLSELGGGLT